MNKKLIWGIVIAVIVIIGIAYINSSISKPLCWPYCENMTDQDRAKIKDSAKQESSNLKITSISKTSGTIGDVIKVRGSLIDARGDQNLRIMNSKGEDAQLITEITRENGEVVMSFVLSEKVCMEFGSDRGGSCAGEFMKISPGEYSIYVKSILENLESNKVKFTVINSDKVKNSEIPLNPNTEPFSMWKKYTDPKNNYSISHPAEYHMAFGSSLINYDENKYENGVQKGVKIQIQKIDKSTPTGQVKEIRHLGINTVAPGDGFDMYDIVGGDDEVYFRINVWGGGNDIHNIINILASFKFITN